jgi:Transglutaminase-like superfamily/TgpA N-terminal domain
MQDASIERLSKLISEPRQMPGGLRNKGPSQIRNLLSQVHIGLAEGWFSLALLAAVVYSAVWSVQAAGWVDHLNILTLTTALGLFLGILAAKQRRWPRLLVHPLALVFGLLLAYWQTASADYNGSLGALANQIRQWIAVALNGGTSTADSIFLFFITSLGFLLAYTSAWLLFRTRSPWLLILANAVVLLINLSNIDPGYIVFLVVFLLASLLLLLRFNLYESSVRWKRMGLRTSDDLGWEFMQAGAMISIGILILTWLLPWGYINDAAAQVWNADSSPWVAIQNDWNRLISVTGGYNPQNHGNFADTLVLGGNPNLTNDIVMKVKSDDGTQYLESLSYDIYDGRTWTNGPTQAFTLRPGQLGADSSIALRAINQQIQVVNPPGEQNAYLLGAPQLATTDQPVVVVERKSDGSVLAWLRTNGKLAAGDVYNVTSYISAADIASLQAIPLPKYAPSFTPNPSIPDVAPPPGYYEPGIVTTYTQLPKDLDPNIKIKAEQVTLGAKNMYDMAVDLENYLHDNFKYNTHINLPAGQEAVSWFLFRSGNQGFCNYFATAMAVMARELGMPARVVAGYTNGTFDSKTHEWIVRGSDAHAWTQIYFAQYGWVNFEPSANFPTFNRPAVTATSVPIGNNGNNGQGSVVTGKKPKPDQNLQGSGGVGLPVGGSGGVGAQVEQDIGTALLLLFVLILGGLLYFNFWWRRLFRGYGLSSQIFGRMAVLANWAGVAPRRSQTPYEYVHVLSETVPDASVTIERLGDIYVRDHWADPASADHPRRTGEVSQLPGLWSRLQPRLFIYALRHPHFLRRIPDGIGKFFQRARRRRRSRDDVLTL